MEYFKQKNISVTGLEIVDSLRNRLSERGYSVFKYFDDLPKKKSFDVISFVDSLYCFENPLNILVSTEKILHHDGILILRITNRTPILNILTFFNKPIPYAFFGDCKHSFSYKGVKILLEKAGFEIHKIFYQEKGKHVPFGRHYQQQLKWLYYKISPILSSIFSVKWSPGLIIVCKKRKY